LRIDLGVLLRFVLLLAMGTASNCRVADNMIRIAISDYRTLVRFSVSILEESGRLGLKCLLFSDFRVGDEREITQQK
jgi:hypothetical protein